MIKVDRNKLTIEGELAEVSAECVMAMRAIYRKNLELFPEPEIAAGILTNMAVKAMMPDTNEDITEEMVLDD